MTSIWLSGAFSVMPIACDEMAAGKGSKQGAGYQIGARRLKLGVENVFYFFRT
jgi:hypothetical protein